MQISKNVLAAAALPCGFGPAAFPYRNKTVPISERAGGTRGIKTHTETDTKMKKFMAGLTLALLAQVTGLHAQTVDYVATVTGIDGSPGSVAVGDTVTGSFTFDYGASVPSQSFGTIGSSTMIWQAAAYGGAAYALAPVPLVFSDSLYGNGFAFSTVASSNSTESVVIGYPNSAYPFDEFYAIATVFQLGGNIDSSEITLADGAGIAAYTSAGIPINGIGGNGYVSIYDAATATNTQVNLAFTSITPAVPELPSSAILGVGLAMLGAATLRQRAANTKSS